LMKNRLRRLEALEGEVIGVLTLPSGERVRYRRGSAQDGGDMFEAFLACMEGREHWLRALPPADRHERGNTGTRAGARG
jgi:hypothetical protein